MRRLCSEATPQSISSTDHPHEAPFTPESIYDRDVLRYLNTHSGEAADPVKIATAYSMLTEQRAKSSKDNSDGRDITQKRDQQTRMTCPFSSQTRAAPLISSRRHQNEDSCRQDSTKSDKQDTRSKRPSFNDPIGTERKEFRSKSPAPSAVSEPACPIRFLDQHSPEDVAKYFEEHKHELPRSHELCVRRFQANSESIRELDAKYGNLVAMIQGLGQKHQPMLPTGPAVEDMSVQEELKPNGEIRDWAEAVSDEEPAESEAHEVREGYFARPLKDVRVGESPSRPWGVPIPAKYLDELDDEEGNRRYIERTPKNDMCPFDQGEVTAEPNKDIPPQAESMGSGQRTDRQSKAIQNDAEVDVEKGKVATIINHRLCLVSGKQLEKKFTVYNYGTMFLGYENESAKDIIRQMQSS